MIIIELMFLGAGAGWVITFPDVMFAAWGWWWRGGFCMRLLRRLIVIWDYG
jgi:hypothetical protein